MLRTARWSGIALLVGGCAASTPAYSFTTTASPRDAVACLTAALDSANYGVERVDRRKGYVLGSQARPGARATDVREFRRLDKLEFQAGKSGVWTYRVFGVKQFASVVGNQTEQVEATDSAYADANRFATSCSR